MHVLILFAIGCVNLGVGPPDPLPLPASSALTDGMLIFRGGRGPEAAAVQAIQATRSWSHVGILSVREDRITVVHAVPAELAGRSDGVVEDELTFFLAPERADAFAVFRVRGTTEAQGHAAEAVARDQLGRPFGLPSGPNSDNLMCTDLVLMAWAGVPGAPILDPETTSLPLLAPAVVTPVDLARLPALERIDL